MEGVINFLLPLNVVDIVVVSLANIVDVSLVDIADVVAVVIDSFISHCC